MARGGRDMTKPKGWADEGFRWVHTDVGEMRCHHRKEGMPAYPDDKHVPSIWVEKGYVRQEEIK